jgi:hypothetical protein
MKPLKSLSEYSTVQFNLDIETTRKSAEYLATCKMCGCEPSSDVVVITYTFAQKIVIPCLNQARKKFSYIGEKDRSIPLKESDINSFSALLFKQVSNL